MLTNRQNFIEHMCVTMLMGLFEFDEVFWYINVRIGEYVFVNVLDVRVCALYNVHSFYIEIESI